MSIRQSEKLRLMHNMFDIILNFQEYGELNETERLNVICEVLQELALEHMKIRMDDLVNKFRE